MDGKSDLQVKTATRHSSGGAARQAPWFVVARSAQPLGSRYARPRKPAASRRVFVSRGLPGTEGWNGAAAFDEGRGRWKALMLVSAKCARAFVGWPLALKGETTGNDSPVVARSFLGHIEPVVG